MLLNVGFGSTFQSYGEAVDKLVDLANPVSVVRG